MTHPLITPHPPFRCHACNAPIDAIPPPPPCKILAMASETPSDHIALCPQCGRGYVHDVNGIRPPTPREKHAIDTNPFVMQARREIAQERAERRRG